MGSFQGVISFVLSFSAAAPVASVLVGEFGAVAMPTFSSDCVKKDKFYYLIPIQQTAEESTH
jgi:hypothetical protein